MPKTFDAVVVGSGASGGWAAKRLTEAGLTVALVDAGRPHTEADFREHTPAFESPLPQHGAGDRAPHAAAAVGVLRVHGAQLRLVRQRSRRAVHDARGQAVQLAGADADHRRTHERVGAPELSLQRPRFQGRVLRRLGRRLAARLRRSRARTTICVEDYVGISGQAEGVYELPDGRFLPPMPLTCPETRMRDRVKSALRPDGHHRPQRQPHAAASRPGGVPLLRSVRTRLRDALVLQRGVHDRRRRARHRPLHPHPERDGLPDVDGPRTGTARPASCTSTASRARFARCPGAS